MRGMSGKAGAWLWRARSLALARRERVLRAGRSHATRPTVVAIVGMHRSGTSALAGTLQEARLYLGDVGRRNPDNAKGTREHTPIVKLHDAILAASGGSWDRPPERVVWTDEHRAHRDEIIRSFSRTRLWGFKDPRTLLLLGFWREALGDSLRLVGTFRHPSAVAASLQAVHGGEAERWLELWATYNRALLAEHSRAAFPVLLFEPDDERYRQAVEQVCRELGLVLPRFAFLEEGLARDAPVELPPVTEELYRELCAIAL